MPALVSMARARSGNSCAAEAWQLPSARGTADARYGAGRCAAGEDIPPAEAEANYYAAKETLDMVARPR